ncbi:MAG: ComF family protein [Candidatus Binatia bacterium]
MIRGAWKLGYVLDHHTVSSEFLGHDEFGNPRFDTRRTELGELVYQLKWHRNMNALETLCGICARFVRGWRINVDVIIPVPPTRSRRDQPLFQLARCLGERLSLRVLEDSVRSRNVRELKRVFDYEERAKLLEGAHSVRDESLRGKRVLVLDDLYRSGATLNAVTRVLYDEGGCSEVYVLAVTRTRALR